MQRWLDDTYPGLAGWNPVTVDGQTDTSGSSWVQLFQAALRFNNMNSGFDGSFSSAGASPTEDFQEFICLPTTATGDYQTWSSLLVSNGDPDQEGEACDCIAEITPARARRWWQVGEQSSAGT